jgi:hypothetical protein
MNTYLVITGLSRSVASAMIDSPNICMLTSWLRHAQN